MGLPVVKNSNVTGIVTASGIDLQDSDGNITVGIVTATNINVGSSGTEFHVTTSAVAIGTATARCCRCQGQSRQDGTTISGPPS